MNPHLNETFCPLPSSITHFRPGSDPFYALAEALVPLYTPDLDATKRMAQTPKLADYFDKGEVTLTKVMANIRRSDPNHQVLLIANQFEEIYTLCSDESTRRRFLDCLLSLIPTNTNQLPTVLVATMRADFFGNCADLSGADLGCYTVSTEKPICPNLKGVKNLTSQQIKAAKNWEQACYDPELRKQLNLPPENPKICVGEGEDK